MGMKMYVVIGIKGKNRDYMEETVVYAGTDWGKASGDHSLVYDDFELQTWVDGVHGWTYERKGNRGVWKVTYARLAGMDDEINKLKEKLKEAQKVQDILLNARVEKE